MYNYFVLLYDLKSFNTNLKNPKVDENNFPFLKKVIVAGCDGVYL